MQATSTIFRRLLLIVLAALLPLVALLGFTLHQQFQRDRAQAFSHLAMLAEINTQQLDRYVNETHQRLARLAEESAVRTATAAECEPLFQRFISFNPRFANAALLDAAGRVAAAANQRPLNPQTSLLKFDRYREAIESPRLLRARDRRESRPRLRIPHACRRRSHGVAARPGHLGAHRRPAAAPARRDGGHHPPQGIRSRGRPPQGEAPREAALRTDRVARRRHRPRFQ